VGAAVQHGEELAADVEHADLAAVDLDHLPTARRDLVDGRDDVSGRPRRCP